MAISIEDVNVLVWRYIVESGFDHTAFVFQNESFIDSSDTTLNKIPPGSLFLLLQKALSYMQLELRIEQIRMNPNDPLYNTISEIESLFPSQFHESNHPITGNSLPSSFFSKFPNFESQTSNTTFSMPENIINSINLLNSNNNINNDSDNSNNISNN